MYEELIHTATDAIQAAKITLICKHEKLVIAAIYCRPRFSLKESDFEDLFNSLGNKFIAGGDYNSKHTFWGARLCNPKGREMLKTLNKNQMKVISGAVLLIGQQIL